MNGRRKKEKGGGVGMKTFVHFLKDHVTWRGPCCTCFSAIYASNDMHRPRSYALWQCLLTAKIKFFHLLLSLWENKLRERNWLRMIWKKWIRIASSNSVTSSYANCSFQIIQIFPVSIVLAADWCVNSMQFNENVRLSALYQTTLGPWISGLFYTKRFVKLNRYRVALGRTLFSSHPIWIRFISVRCCALNKADRLQTITLCTRSMVSFDKPLLVFPFAVFENFC